MPSPPLRLLYDDRCLTCVRTRRCLAALDWGNRLEWVGLSGLGDDDLPSGISREALLLEIHCLEPGGGFHRGVEALRHAGLRLPAVAPFAFLLGLPIVKPLAVQVYRWVAGRRRRCHFRPG